jgi:serine/threonine protein kinase
MINNYKILGSLGEGSYGKVKLCIKKMLDLEKKYAMKIFKKSKLMKIRTMKKNANGGTKTKIKLL